MNTLPRNAPLFQAVPLEQGRGLRLVGELDLSTVTDLDEMLAALPSDAGEVTLDLAELSFIDSSGLRTLVLYARALDGRGPLVLENVSPSVRRLFELTGIDEYPGITLRDGEDRG